MTRNQIAWFEAKEAKRHNVATETETQRMNTIVATETNRHNVASEGLQHEANVINQQHYERMDAETNRHNVATERETERHNQQTERVDLWFKTATTQEQARHNRATEAQTESSLNLQAGNLLLQVAKTDIEKAKTEAEIESMGYRNILTQQQSLETLSQKYLNEIRAEKEHASIYQGWGNLLLNGAKFGMTAFN